MVHTLYAVMCAFALAATVRIVDEGFLKYGGYVVVYEMVHHPVTKNRQQNISRFTGLFTMIALHRHVFLQIPDATDAEPKPLIVVVAVHISVVTVHVPVPGIC